MNLVPTWDLFILIFGVIIIAYSFIIGRHRTVKIIISSYIAILAADGIGNLLYTHFLAPDATFPALKLSLGSEYLAMIKVVGFIAAIVLMTLHGSFEAEIKDGGNQVVSVATTMLYGVLSAALIVSAILVYVSGGSFVTAFIKEAAITPSELSRSIYTQSQIAKLLIDNSALIFSLPAVVFIVNSFVLPHGAGSAEPAGAH